MDLGLQDKIIVVSGGAGRPGSIGETIVRALADEGAVPVIVDRDRDRGQALARALAEAGRAGGFVEADLTAPGACERAVRETLDRYGRIEGVVNNLGFNDGVGLDRSEEDFVASLRLNLVPVFGLVRHSREALRAARGAVVNVSSKVAVTGQGRTSAYAAAKGGILALTREWAVDLVAHGIRVNAVLPAECWTPAYEDWVRTRPDPEAVLERITRRIPLGRRMTRPEEIADAVLFLLSDRASHVTGQHLYVDGGYVHLDRALQDLNE